MKVTFDTELLTGQSPQYAIGFCRGLLGTTAPTRPQEQIGWQMGKRALEDSRKESTEEHLLPAMDAAFEHGRNARKVNVPKSINPYTVSHPHLRAAWNRGWNQEDDRIQEAGQEPTEQRESSLPAKAEVLDRLDEVQDRLTELEFTQDRDRSEVQRQLESEREAVRILKQEVAVLKTRLAEVQEHFLAARDDFLGRLEDLEAETPERDSSGRLHEVHYRLMDLELNHKTSRQETMDRLDGLFRRVAELERKEPVVRVQRQALSRIEGRVNSLEEGQIHLREDMNNRLDELDQRIEATADALEAVLAEKDAKKEGAAGAPPQGVLDGVAESICDALAELPLWQLEDEIHEGYHKGWEGTSVLDAILGSLRESYHRYQGKKEVERSKEDAAKEEFDPGSFWSFGITAGKVRSFAELVAEKICEASPPGGREDVEPFIVDIIVKEMERLDDTDTRKEPTDE